MEKKRGIDRLDLGCILLLLAAAVFMLGGFLFFFAKYGNIW
jgi:hypothetical protein